MQKNHGFQSNKPIQTPWGSSWDPSVQEICEALGVEMMGSEHCGLDDAWMVLPPGAEGAKGARGGRVSEGVRNVHIHTYIHTYMHACLHACIRI